MESEETVVFEIEFYKGDPFSISIPADVLPQWQRTFKTGRDLGRGIIQLSIGDTGMVLVVPCSNILGFYPDKGA